jgi:hypothetical protein
MGEAMDRPAIAKQQDDIDFSLEQQLPEKPGPRFKLSAKRDRFRRRKQPVTPAEVDLAHLCARPLQIASQSFEKGSHRPLQQKNFFPFENGETFVDHLVA